MEVIVADSLVYWFPGAAITEDHQLGGSKQQTYSLTVLEARSLESRCWQDHGLLTSLNFCCCG